MITAIYDGHCVICNATRRLITLLDWFHRVEFLDLHDHEQVTRRFPVLNHTHLMGEIHVMDGDQVYRGFNGTRRLLRAVPLGLPLWAFLHLPGVSGFIGQRLYRFIARHRYAINRLMGVDLNTPGTCKDDLCRLPVANVKDKENVTP